MYSYEERMKAVKLYIQYDLCCASVCRGLGYPDQRSLILWYKEYLANGDLRRTFIKTSAYSDEQRKAAIDYYLQHGRSKTHTIKAFGYPTRQQLLTWIKQDIPEENRRCTASNSLVNLTQEQKNQAVVELYAKEGSAQEIASKYGVSRCYVYNWARHLLGKGSALQMQKKEPISSSTNDIEALRSEIAQLHCEADELKRQVYRLQLEKDVLEKTAEIIKKMRASVRRISPIMKRLS